MSDNISYLAESLTIRKMLHNKGSSKIAEKPSKFETPKFRGAFHTQVSTQNVKLTLTVGGWF